MGEKSGRKKKSKTKINRNRRRVLKGGEEETMNFGGYWNKQKLSFEMEL